MMPHKGLAITCGGGRKIMPYSENTILHNARNPITASDARRGSATVTRRSWRRGQAPGQLALVELPLGIVLCRRVLDDNAPNHFDAGDEFRTDEPEASRKCSGSLRF